MCPGQRLVLGALTLALGPCFAAASETQPVCPEEITVEQKVLSMPSGWTASDDEPHHGFVNVMFSEGPPADRVILAPARQIKVKGAQVNTWSFIPSKAGYWVSCVYTGTSMVVAKPLPMTVKTCQVEYDPVFSSPVIKRWSCQVR